MSSTGTGVGTPVIIPSTPDPCAGCEDIRQRPGISLEEWRQSVAIHPYYFWQLGQDKNLTPGTPVPVNTGSPCESLVFDNGAQGSPVAGRDEIYNTILRVDERIRDYLGYWPRPSYSCEEMSFKQGYVAGRLRLKNAKLRALGRETWDLLDTVAIDAEDDITDDDGDTILDTVTITIPVVTGVSISEIALVFTQPDWRKQDRYRNEIRPINVERVDENWVITFPSWLFVKPKLYAGLLQNALDPDDLTIYATSVDVYRRWTDPAQAITVMRKPGLSCLCGNTEDCYTCSYADPCIVDASRGIIELKLSRDVCRLCAQRLIIHYESGDQIDTDTLARLYAGYLGRDVCCGETNPILRYWQADYVTLDGKGKVTTALTMLERGNPFGTTRGAIDAYHAFSRRRARKAVRL